MIDRTVEAILVEIANSLPVRIFDYSKQNMNWHDTLNNNVGSELRYLKGGSGGGGGGGGSYSSSRGSSYSSRGGYYYGTNSSGGGSGEAPTWVWIMLL